MKVSPLTPSFHKQIAMELADAIRKARETRDISVTALADNSGTSRSTIYNIEKAQGVSDLPTIAALGYVLGMTWNELLPALLPAGSEPPGGAALPVVSPAIACDPGKSVPKNAPTRVFDAATLRKAGWNEARTGRFVAVEAPADTKWGWPTPSGGSVLVVDREPNREMSRGSLWLSTDGKSLGVVRPGQGAAILEPGSGMPPQILRGAARKQALGARVVLVVSEP